ncbi:glycosyltransferase family 4 protein [Haloferax sp. YSMS24]|uniref:glycosyltransferase family 4 protein n=1 Tax=Haloferax sp. YSMS24 TaxID=3388425 RepID=UPI00398CEA69
MKVLFITPGVHPYSIGGIETHVRNLAEALQPEKVSAYALSQNTVFEFGHETTKSKISYFNRVKAIVSDEYDVVHLHGFVSHDVLNLWLLENEIIPLLANLQGTKVVFTPHGGVDGVLKKSWDSYIFSAYLKFLQKVLFPLVDSFIAIYPNQVRTFKQSGIPKEKIEFIPNGVSQGDKKSSKTDTPTIVYLGSLKPHKRVSDLVAAISRLSVDANVIIAGADKGTLSKIQSEAAEMGIAENLEYKGMVDDETKWEIYNEADLFVNPSEYEAFGLSAAEAMSVGTPVICAENPGSKYLLKGGESGILYQPGDIESLAESIDIVLSDSQRSQELSTKAEERANDFDWKEIAQLMSEVYYSLSS